MQYFKTLFSSGPYMPHGYCFLWNPGLVSLHVISDSLIALPYLSIALALLYFVRKRRDLPFHWMFLSFGVGDRAQLQHVLLNLIVNGVEAMNSDSDLSRVLMLLSHTRASELEVTVQDSGTDLDPRDVPHPFDTFFTTKTTGMGMGLSISRTIIEAHSGRLWASPNRAAQGTAFHSSLPAIAQPQP